ncbi:MAG: repeat containing protein [Bacillales bacterium]|jgi:DNA-binding beta-propeller fold protein YncE|nr:repeat containing protein [Bacillales bacterium]
MENFQSGLKKKYVYFLMSIIVILVILLYSMIEYLGWQNNPLAVLGKINGGEPKYTKSIYGADGNQLIKPMDVYSDGKFIFVSDTGNYQVQVFDKKTGKLELKFGTRGSEPGEFQYPYGITSDESGKLYIADMKNSNISIFDKKGNFIEYFVPKEEEDKIISPSAIRIFNQKLYVPEINTGYIKIFDLSGNKILDIKVPAESFVATNSPNGIAIDKENNIYVSDTGRSRIIVYDDKGKFLKEITGAKKEGGKSILVCPRGIVVDKDGTIYVVDSLGHSIFGFNSKGDNVFKFGKLGNEAGQFFVPNGLFLEEDGSIFVTDTINERIQIFN